MTTTNLERCHVMATDYDAPRKPDDEPENPAVLQVMSRPSREQDGGLDHDATQEVVELPGADLSGEEFVVPLVPIQPDELVCTRCFLVHHRSRSSRTPGPLICADCEAVG